MTVETTTTTGAELAVAAAEAVAQVMPAVESLTASAAQPGSEHVTALFEGAAVVDLEGALSGTVALLVAADLVGALASSPLGGLDLAAAVQPALDAAAQALGASAGAARQIGLDEVLATLGEPFTVVPLIGAGIAGAVAVSDATLDRAAARSSAAPSKDAPVFAAPQALPDLTREAPAHAPAAPQRGFEMLHGVTLDVTVELGRTQLTVRELLDLVPGAVLGLDRVAGSPADVLVNGRLIARGEVVVVDEDFGLRVTEIVHDRAAG